MLHIDTTMNFKYNNYLQPTIYFATISFLILCIH
jgi:hypothetical protein